MKGQRGSGQEAGDSQGCADTEVPQEGGHG